MTNTILRLRKKLQMSQEEFASILGVSKQAVQKWETGKNLPDLNHLMLLRSKFNISLDELVYGNEVDIMAFRFKPTLPDYAAKSVWDEYSKNLLIEFVQSYEEGKEIEYLKNLIEEVNSLKDSKEKHDMADIIYNLINEAPIRKNYKYVEPSSFDEILPLIKNSYFKKVNANINKLTGAITGRVVGCMLGKPVEGVLREDILKMLKASNNYPITRYISKDDVLVEVPISSMYCVESITNGALVDDDIDYICLNQYVIEEYGMDFTSSDILNTWLDLMPRNTYCTAERVAYNNYVNGYLPPDCAKRKNVYREWIGAQIRADYFGYICPGNPHKAIELAYKDACVSHTKNGIYGEMYFAALLAIAASETDHVKACKLALNYIPCTSRLYEVLLDIIEGYENGVSEQRAFSKIFSKYDNSNLHHWLHVICNASIVVASVLYGNKDFTKSISLAVSSGYDTDCNGATVGSIVGMLCGIECISSHWLVPIQGKMNTDMNKKHVITIENFVKTALKHIKED